MFFGLFTLVTPALGIAVCNNITLWIQVFRSAMAAAPPPNFSWVEPQKLAGLAMPRMTAHYQYLLNSGIKHLITLSERKPPYCDTCPDLTLHHIRIHDFCAPTFDQIKRFLSIVEGANSKGEVKTIYQNAITIFSFLVLYLFVIFFAPGCCSTLYAWLWKNWDYACLLLGKKQKNLWNWCH